MPKTKQRSTKFLSTKVYKVELLPQVLCMPLIWLSSKSFPFTASSWTHWQVLIQLQNTSVFPLQFLQANTTCVFQNSEFHNLWRILRAREIERIQVWLTLASPNSFAWYFGLSSRGQVEASLDAIHAMRANACNTHNKCNPSTGTASHHTGLQLTQRDSTHKDECSPPVVSFLVMFQKCMWVWSPAISKHSKGKGSVYFKLVEDKEDCWLPSSLKKEWIIVFHMQICLSNLGSCSTWQGWLQWHHHHLTST